MDLKEFFKLVHCTIDTIRNIFVDDIRCWKFSKKDHLEIRKRIEFINGNHLRNSPHIYSANSILIESLLN